MKEIPFKINFIKLRWRSLWWLITGQTASNSRSKTLLVWHQIYHLFPRTYFLELILKLVIDAENIDDITGK